MWHRALSILLLLVITDTALGSGDFERVNSDYLSLADNAAHTLAFTGFTVAFWVKLDGYAGTADTDVHTMWSCTDGSAYAWIYMDEYGANSDKWYFRWGSGASKISYLDTVSTDWVHLAMVGRAVDTTEYLDCYVNGSATTMSDASMTGIDPTTIYLGRGATAGSNTWYLDGRMAEWVLYQDDLSGAQITQLQTEKPSAVGSPALYIPMYDDGAEDIIDLTVTNNGVTFSGADHPISYGTVLNLLKSLNYRGMQ